MSLERSDRVNDDSNTAPDSSEQAAPRAPTDALVLKPGTQVRRFIVLNELGSGGQGVVYAAYDPTLGRNIALKMLRSASAQGGADQLLREARELARFSHPHVVTVHDVDSFAGTVFIAMQLAEEGSIAQWAKKRSPSRAELIERFLEAGKGLAALHKRGLVHRDFKPDNVLIDESGIARVSDFGLVRAATDARSHAGTTRFMAPEQRAAGTASEKSDQFAFCVSLYLLLTGVMPEPGPLKFPSGDPTPPSLRRLLARGLAERPDDRFPSMEALLTELAFDPAAQRRRTLKTAAAVSAVGLVAAVLSVWAFTESPAQRTRRECLEQVEKTRATLWSPEKVEQMQRSFTAAAGSVGTQTFERVRARMEPEVATWARESTVACELEDATARRLRQSCLDARGQTLATMTALFSGADRSVVDSAVLTLGLEVRAVESCQTSATGLPKLDDTEADQRLRARLAPARVLRTAWRFEDARTLALEVATEAEEQGAPHVLAEAQLLAGQLSADLHEPGAPQRLKRAIELAEASGSDEVRARAWMALVSLHASRREFPAARDAEKQAVAIVQRLGWPEVLEAQLRNQEGNLQLALGDLEAAHTAYVRQRELLQRYRPESDPLVSRAINNVLLSGGRDERLEGFKVLLERTTAALGPTHPETLFTRHNLAAALLASGQCDAAEKEVRAVLETRLAAVALYQPFLQGEYLLHARTLACLARYPEAVAAHRKGFELMQEAGAPETDQRAELSWQLEVMKRAGSPKPELARVEQELEQINP